MNTSRIPALGPKHDKRGPSLNSKQGDPNYSRHWRNLVIILNNPCITEKGDLIRISTSVRTADNPSYEFHITHLRSREQNTITSESIKLGMTELFPSYDDPLPDRQNIRINPACTLAKKLKPPQTSQPPNKCWRTLRSQKRLRTHQETGKKPRHMQTRTTHQDNQIRQTARLSKRNPNGNSRGNGKKRNSRNGWANSIRPPDRTSMQNPPTPIRHDQHASHEIKSWRSLAHHEPNIHRGRGNTRTHYHFRKKQNNMDKPHHKKKKKTHKPSSK